jgi:preprotein translocase SecE subunit
MSISNEYNREEGRLLQREEEEVEAEPASLLRREERRPAVPAPAPRPGFHPREFLDEVVLEMRKVMKPKRAELVNYATVVFFTLAFLMALVYGLDYLYSLGASQLFK